MKLSRTIISIIAVAVLVGFGLYNNIHTSNNTVTKQGGEIKKVDTTENQQGVGVSTSSVESQTVKDLAWSVFQTYLNRAKAHDISGVKELSYQQSTLCADPKQKEACSIRMDNVYDIGSTLKKSDYKNIWSDAKQLILFTDSTYIHTEKADAYQKGFIYFTRDSQGTPKVLAMSPARQWVVTREATTTDAQVATTLSNMMKDTDEDGITDFGELCLEGVTEKQGCIKTDPYRRDTNGNGYWDGVENYFYH